MENMKNQKLTAEQELLVRKYVSDRFFNVEAFIEHLNNNEMIKIDIFYSYLRQNLQILYLQSYKPVSKDVFIRRIPVYFYSLNNYKNKVDITKLFISYAMYINNNSKFNGDNSINQDLVNSYNVFSCDFEPLYFLLEKNYYFRKIPLQGIFEYLNEQIGQLDFSILEKWSHYLDLLVELKDDIIFPNNILYAYNKELVMNGKNPIIYYPNSMSLTQRTKNGRKMILDGLFPIDDNNEPILEWIGIWYENVGNISIVRKVMDVSYADQVFGNVYGKLLHNSIAIELKNDSIVYLARNRYNKFEGKLNNVWKEVYSGPKHMIFNYTIISKCRENLKIAQKEMAEDLEINLRTFQRFEAGESTPDALNLMKIMKYLGIDSHEIFTLKEEILDDEFKKFKSGLKLSEFIKKE